MIQKEKISFTSFDGVEINCLKLVPDVPNETKIPAILFQPGNRTTPEDYLWLLEPLAERGWLVLGIYQRGYGSDIPDTNDRGGPIQQKDFQLALETLSKDPSVDIERIALVGHSNGGHIAQRMAIPNKVKCVVAMSQVSDWGIFVSGAKDYLPDYYQEIVREFKGSPQQNPQPYVERSCLHLADQLKVPVLAVVGGDDTITPPHLTRLMHERLFATGNKKSEMVVIPGVGHFYEVYAFNGYLTGEVAKVVADWLQKTL